MSIWFSSPIKPLVASAEALAIRAARPAASDNVGLAHVAVARGPIDIAYSEYGNEFPETKTKLLTPSRKTWLRINLGGQNSHSIDTGSGA